MKLRRSGKPFRLGAAAALAVVVGVASRAAAYPDGRFQSATTESGGCGCHSSAVSNPTPAVDLLVLIDGRPISGFGGYVPGRSYAVSVWVLGPKLAFGGFNLQVSAGTLVAVDTTAQTRMLTECELLQANTFPACKPGVAGSECGVVTSPSCPVYDPNNFDCRPCTTISTTCRACDAVKIVDIEATHTLPPLAIDAKPVPSWDLTWTAPSPGVGDVRFWMAGNSVVPDKNTGDDMWNFLGPNPTVVHQASN